MCMQVCNSLVERWIFGGGESGGGGMGLIRV